MYADYVGDIKIIRIAKSGYVMTHAKVFGI